VDPDDRIAQTVPFVPPHAELTDELVLSVRQLPTVFQEVILLCDIEDCRIRRQRRPWQS
jgi:hypothetical protein